MRRRFRYTSSITTSPVFTRLSGSPRQSPLASQTTFVATKKSRRWRNKCTLCFTLPTMRDLLTSLLLTLLVPIGSAQTCRLIHGRAILYRGDSFFTIWHVGTDHIFFLVDQPSIELVCRYFDCASGDKQPALFADFTVCPTKRYIAGAAQPVIVKKVEHPLVVPEWPPDHKR